MANKVETTVVRISPKSISRKTRFHWNSLVPFNLSGEPSTWKSIKVYVEAQEIASDEKREFLDWNRSSPTRKREAVNNAERFFVFADLRASEMDIGELRLQDIKAAESFITFKYNILFEALSKEDAKGIIFFDEMNLAPNMIKAQFYKVINDHAVGDLPLAKNVLCCCAGNEAEHARGVTEDPVPLVLRRFNYFVRPPTDEEFLEYAVPTGLHQWIIGYLGFQPQDVHKIKYDLPDGVGQPCSRTWTLLSKLLIANEGMKMSDAELEEVACGAVGQAIGRQFVSYVKTARKVDLDSFLKDPASIKDFETDANLSMIYAIFAGVVEKFRTDKDGTKIVKPAFELALHIKKPELGVYLLRSMKVADEKKLIKAASTEKNIDKDTMKSVTDRYGKYLWKQTSEDV